ncbi:MAG: hypothetical protein DI535_14550 [Citrobacter freundii]|nr:MAG: hypothetical protein DI535_14550 [Citrobacter freundii]
MQSVQIIQPHPELSPWIRDYAFFVHQIDGWTSSYSWKMPAFRDHTLQLFIDNIPTLFSNSTQQQFSVKRFNIFGMVDHSFLDSHMPAWCTRIQVTFKPSGLFYFTGIAGSTFSNLLTDGSLVFGSNTNLLIEQLSESKTNAQKALAIDDFLLRRLHSIRKKQETRLTEMIAHEILSDPTVFDLKTLSTKFCKSPRQLERLFKEQVGIPLKKFQCLNRFVYSNLLRHKNPGKSWLDIALDAGYYDLNHLAKDFQYYGRSSVTGFSGYGYENDIVVPNQ